MTNRLSMILFVGEAHSKANAEKILEWFRAEKRTADMRAALIQDWRQRGFLTAADARELERAA